MFAVDPLPREMFVFPTVPSKEPEEKGDSSRCVCANTLWMTHDSIRGLPRILTAVFERYWNALSLITTRPPASPQFQALSLTRPRTPQLSVPCTSNSCV